MEFKKNKDTFITIIVIAILSVGLFYLVTSCNMDSFTNNKKLNKLYNKKANIKEHLNAGASLDDPTVLQTGDSPSSIMNMLSSPNLNADVPSLPGAPAEPATIIPESVLASAQANKSFPTGQFKPLLLTPAPNEITSLPTASNSANFNSEYTLGVDQTLANPSGREMQTSTDLRPQEMNSGWFNSPYDRDTQLNIENGNLLASATGQAQIGIDTIGQSLRNASYDIRGSVPIPKIEIGPFNNSTIEYDYNIKSLY